MSHNPRRPARENPPGGENAAAGWNGARRELAVAGLLAAVLTAAAWALDGPAAAGFVLLTCIAVSLVVLRALIEPDQEPPAPESAGRTRPRPVLHRVLADAIRSDRCHQVAERLGVRAPPQAHEPARGQALGAPRDQPGRRSAGGQGPAPGNQARPVVLDRPGAAGLTRRGLAGRGLPARYPPERARCPDRPTGEAVTDPTLTPAQLTPGPDGRALRRGPRRA